MNTKPNEDKSNYVRTISSANAADLKPWKVFAGTIIHNDRGQVVLAAHEESERCGGTFDSIRQGIAESVQAVNQFEAFNKVAEAAEKLDSNSPNKDQLRAVRLALSTLNQIRQAK